MSTGPGNVERAIRELIERHHGRAGEDTVYVYSDELYEAAFGRREWKKGAPAPYTKAERSSALRAMHRIMGREPGWIREREDEPTYEDEPKREIIVFSWDYRRSKAKPQTLREPILAYSADGWRLRWKEAVIVSRAVRKRSRVTVEYNGRKVQCTELPSGRIILGRSTVPGIAGFCHERARELVEAQHREARLRYSRPTPEERRPSNLTDELIAEDGWGVDEDGAPPAPRNPLN